MKNLLNQEDETIETSWMKVQYEIGSAEPWNTAYQYNGMFKWKIIINYETKIIDYRFQQWIFLRKLSNIYKSKFNKNLSIIKIYLIIFN
jgi:hypothetical protein